MKPSIEKLQKFFKLEAERGFDNKAVMGGLPKMLDSWIPYARSDGIGEDLINAITSLLRDYSRLSVKSRREILSGIWKRIMKELELPPIEELNFQKKSPVTTTPPPPTTKSHTEPAKPKPPQVDKRTSNLEQVSFTELDAPVSVIQGIGTQYTKALNKLGINKISDLLFHFPRRYDDYSKLKQINRLTYGEVVTIIGTVQSSYTRKIKNGKLQLIEAIISDGSGAIKATWFNQPWLKQMLKEGNQIVLSGKIDQYLGKFVLNNPEIEQLDHKNLHTNRIVPVYPLTASIRQKRLRAIMNQTVTYWAPRIKDFLPEDIVAEENLLDLSTALLQVHFPDSQELLKQAQSRLAFDEIFLLQIGVLKQKLLWEEQTAQTFQIDETWLNQRLNHLPYTLTNAQMGSLKEIISDLSSGHPMNRLLQGDVGSGKTVVAAITIASIASHGGQTAIMAPTGLLAEQHYNTLKSILVENDTILEENQIKLLTSATPRPEKDTILNGLKDGQILLVVGTHALIEDPIIFKNLQLVVIDEQHRFGVKQRALLREKGNNPHLLVMTATPIPRSLSLTIYGDLDVSIIDEMPPGRQEIVTKILSPKQREIANRLIRREIDAGRQAFVIYPLIEESNTTDYKGAVEGYERYKTEIFPDLNIGLLHGKMKDDEKNLIMSKFRDGEIDILVSTSVIEVGVDVPNATVMIIEGADRFGLAQLHQFRGRIGRGEHKSYCVLIPTKEDAIINKRLKAIEETNNGFILAEKDLELRGPGQFLGTRQSGFINLRLANITDTHLIKRARQQALKILEKDPQLSNPENQHLAEVLEKFWQNQISDIS